MTCAAVVLVAASSEQRRVFDGIAFAMRSAAIDLGVNADALLAAFNRHWMWRPERQQKGVDTLITLDLVRLAQCGAFHTAVLVAGDRDLAEPVRTAQDAGCQVVATVGGQASLAKELAQLADEVIEIPQDNLAAIVTRPSRREPNQAGDLVTSSGPTEAGPRT